MKDLLVKLKKSAQKDYSDDIAISNGFYIFVIICLLLIQSRHSIYLVSVVLLTEYGIELFSKDFFVIVLDEIFRNYMIPATMCYLIGTTYIRKLEPLDPKRVFIKLYAWILILQFNIEVWNWYH